MEKICLIGKAKVLSQGSNEKWRIVLSAYWPDEKTLQTNSAQIEFPPMPIDNCMKVAEELKKAFEATSFSAIEKTAHCILQEESNAIYVKEIKSADGKAIKCGRGVRLMPQGII